MKTLDRREMRLEEWRSRTIVPMVVAAAVFLAAYAWPIIDSDLPGVWRAVCDAVMLVVWALFAADYLVRLWLAPSRWAFVRGNWFDLLVLLVLLVLLAPMPRSLRLVQVIMVLGLVNRHASMSLRASVSRYSAVAAVLIVFCAALAVLDAERGAPEAGITTFPDPVWGGHHGDDGGLRRPVSGHHGRAPGRGRAVHGGYRSAGCGDRDAGLMVRGEVQRGPGDRSGHAEALGPGRCIPPRPRCSYGSSNTRLARTRPAGPIAPAWPGDRCEACHISTTRTHPSPEPHPTHATKGHRHASADLPADLFKEDQTYGTGMERDAHLRLRTHPA